MDSLVKNLLENQTKEKIQKPNCQTRTGRSLLAFYLTTKFKQIINYDKKSPKQMIINYKQDFLERFTNRLIERPDDRILIALSGESASGKSTICKQIQTSISNFNLPVSILHKSFNFLCSTPLGHDFVIKSYILLIVIDLKFSYDLLKFIS